MKDHLIFVGKVAIGCAVAIIVVNYFQKSMAAKSTAMLPILTPTTVADTAPTV